MKGFFLMTMPCNTQFVKKIVVQIYPTDVTHPAAPPRTTRSSLHCQILSHFKTSLCKSERANTDIIFSSQLMMV